jgi:hypothetical protein
MNVTGFAIRVADRIAELNGSSSCAGPVHLFGMEACETVYRMSFLDNLENNLKALEANEQGGLDEGNRREAAKKRALAEKPWADRLKNDPWTANLMQRATRAGFERRTKVNLIWVGTTLRLEARGQRLELRPGTTGVAAVLLRGAERVKEEAVNLSGDPAKLIANWMVLVETQKKRDDEQAAARAAELEADNAD